LAEDISNPKNGTASSNILNPWERNTVLGIDKAHLENLKSLKI
jgi:hypothetical protein